MRLEHIAQVQNLIDFLVLAEQSDSPARIVADQGLDNGEPLSSALEVPILLESLEALLRDASNYNGTVGFVADIAKTLRGDACPSPA